MDLRYPIGKFSFQAPATAEQRRQWIDEIAQTPRNIRAAVAGLGAAQLDTPYREGGWTVRQVVHHVPDSHMNAYVRFKLALTEHEPAIKPYDEAAWAQLSDSVDTPIEVSLTLLEALHLRWARVLESIDEAGWKRTFRHPELGVLPLERNLALYAWHGRHHTAHITGVRQRNGW